MTTAGAGYSHWDVFIRLGHWLMAALFLANYWWLEAGEEPHEWVGYGLFAILCLRLVRGFTGAENGRFRDFFPTPARLRHSLVHFTEEHQLHQHQVRHTGLAGLMVCFLLLAMMVTAVSGWMQELDMFWGEDWVQNLHSWSADAVMLAVVVHVAAVLLLQWCYKLPLVRAMFNGS